MLAVNEPPAQVDTPAINFDHYRKFSNLDRLNALERRIVESVQKITMTKLEVCIALAKISLNKLYLESGVSSFKEYLKANRIPIHYRTAHDYAKIGEVYLKHRAAHVRTRQTRSYP